MTDEWVEDDRLWVESYASMFPASSFELARREVDQIVALTGMTGGALLDLACGPGRHSVPFAARGFTVTGVDRSRFLLDQARAHAGEQGVDVEWVERDMRQFARPDAFDAAVCLFTSFGLFDAHADNQRVLHNLYRDIRAGGALVLDVMGKEVLARIFRATASTYLDDGRLFVQRREIIDDWTRIDVEWLYLRGDEVSYRKRISHWLYSARELRGMLEAAGFADVVIYGALTGAPYDSEARRLVTVARRA